MSFIQKMLIDQVKELDLKVQNPSSRLQNIAWPSESMVNIGSYPVGECKRAFFYKVVGEKQTDPGGIRSQRIFDAGIKFEESIIYDYKKYGFFFKEQERIEFKFPKTKNEIASSGKLDLLIKDGKELNGIEIKSVSAYKAPEVMGTDSSLPYPAASNLMQAMNYKYYYLFENISDDNVKDIYLQYVNRSDGSMFYYKIDLDKEGWAIITAINEGGKEIYTVNSKDIPSFDDLLNKKDVASSSEYRAASCKININSVFKKFDDSYSYINNKMLPPPDYKVIYNKDDIEIQHKIGNLSKQKYNQAKKGEIFGDKKCMYCSYRKKCLSDSGIKLK